MKTFALLVLLCVTGFGQTTITPLPGDLWDNLETTNYGTHYQQSAFARLIVNTTATSVTVNFQVTVSFTYCRGLPVFVNGAYHGRVIATGAGANSVTYGLPGGDQRVEIQSGCQATATPHTGSFIVSATFNAPATLVSPVNSGVDFVTVLGDSISQGEAMASDDIGQYSAFHWLRRTVAGYGYRVQFSGAGGMALKICCNTPTQRNALIAQYQSRITDSPRNVFYIELATNDWASTWHTASAFQTLMGDWLDALHAAFPQSKILVQSMLLTGNESDVNGNGETPAAFRTAAQNACASRVWATFVDGTAMISVMSDGGATTNIFGVHPTYYGHPKWGWAIARQIYAALH